MLQNLKQRLIDYADAFTTYDYAAFGWLIFLLLILIVLAITLSKRKPKFASFLIFLVLILMFSAPVAIKIFLDKTIRKVSIVDQNHTKLNFSKVLVVTGTVKNEGKVDLNKCYLSTKVLKLTGNH
ncbi:MAG: DUF2393 domain-containing protein, partial [Epsilonproteobacteria bacterium]|nr:DUF2393 domain-containing protein [Campylobacterota bacterium]